ncbi:GNAT family N-acetyltransferase [Niabella aquatica]
MKYFETVRLTVRRFKESDAQALFDYFENPRVHCFADEKVSSIEEARTEVIKRSKDASQFAVCLKENDLLIGNLFAVKEGDTYSVGWNFNSRFEGKGLAIEAAGGLLEYLFTQKGARRIYAYVEEDNTRSQKLCERLGMRKEGLFLEYISFVKNADGTPEYENTIQFALLKKEWEQVKR